MKSRSLILLLSLLLASQALAEEKAKVSKDLVLDLGGKQNLEFVWLESLKMWLGKYEVTNGQYRRFDPKHDSGKYKKWTLNKDDQPVVKVSWNDARKFCNWLNENHGAGLTKDYGFRLPSESEWVAYAKCGDDREYPWGNKWQKKAMHPAKFLNRLGKNIDRRWYYVDLTDYPWGSGRYPWGTVWPPPKEWKVMPPPDDWNYMGEERSRRFPRGSGWQIYYPWIQGHRDGFPVTCPVAKSGANDWGLFGIGGNVWEWCEDWYNASNRIYRGVRGGAWDSSYEDFLRISLRSGELPEQRADDIGFRVIGAPAFDKKEP